MITMILYKFFDLGDTIFDSSIIQYYFLSLSFFFPGYPSHRVMRSIFLISLPLLSVDIFVSNITFPFIIQHYIFPTCLESSSFLQVSDWWGRPTEQNFRCGPMVSFLRYHNIILNLLLHLVADVAYTKGSSHLLFMKSYTNNLIYIIQLMLKRK